MIFYNDFEDFMDDDNDNNNDEDGDDDDNYDDDDYDRSTSNDDRSSSAAQQPWTKQKSRNVSQTSGGLEVKQIRECVRERGGRLSPQPSTHGEVSDRRLRTCSPNYLRGPQGLYPWN